MLRVGSPRQLIGHKVLARHTTLLERLVLAIGAAFVLQLPAELALPLIRIGPIGVTNLELTGYALVAAAALFAAARGQLPAVRPWLVLGLGIVLIAAALSSATALYDASAAWKVSLRLVGAALVGWALAYAASTIARALTLVGAVGLLAATVSAGLGIAEFFTGWDVLGPLLSAFRDEPLTVGGVATRATGSLLHPNVAAWYWGVAGIGAVLVTVTARRRAVSALAIAAAAVLLIAATLAMSRGALLGTGAAALTAAWLLVRDRRDLRGAAIVLVGLPVVVVVVALASPIARTRLVTETDAEWYRAAITAPDTVAFEGPSVEVPLQVHNASPIAWPSTGNGSVAVSYHLYSTSGELVTYQGEETPLGSDIVAGATVEVTAQVLAPDAPGEYRIKWDLLQDGRTWFSARWPLDDASTVGTVTPDVASMAPPTDRKPGPDAGQQDLVFSRTFPRSQLWMIAREMLAARPLNGIGLDNFRLGYGTWAGLDAWDTDINSHNLYLEVALGIGVLGAIALFAVAGIAVLRAYRLARASPVNAAAVSLLILAAIAVHGLFDAFLTHSTPMYLVASALVVALTGRRGPMAT